MPLVPSALFLWALNFSDRFFLVKLAGPREVGLYSIGVRMASAIILFLARWMRGQRSLTRSRTTMRPSAPTASS